MIEVGLDFGMSLLAKQCENLVGSLQLRGTGEISTV